MNHFQYWSRRFLTDGLKAIKVILGLGIAFILGLLVSKILGILCLAWVFVDSLIQKN